jgi:hypothetical protein
MLSGDKPFDVKADIPLVSSFIGRQSNYDGREFASVEAKIKEIDATLSALENRPDLYKRYVEDHPYEPAVVEAYHELVNGQLRDIRSMKNQINASDWTASRRKPVLDDLKLSENFIKRRMIDIFAQYGVEP